MMKKYCDLHTHSYFSDGTDSPKEILDKAVEAGLSAVALTDHNTVAGLPEFLESAKGKDILAIPGVEISTGYNGKELHIVGLFLEPEHYGETAEFLAVINQRKIASNRQLVCKLKAAGYTLDYDEITEKHQGNVNRAVIAAALLEKGYISEIKEAFKGLLSTKNGLYTPPERISSFEAIEFLKSIGAVPVLAHPFLNLTETDLSTRLRPFGFGVTLRENGIPFTHRTQHVYYIVTFCSCQVLLFLFLRIF
jgi:predicted metal-dependent phosphoesterase TrpH